MKKVLFFDIDGTLLNSELKIPEGVKEGDIVRVINGKILKDEKKTEEVSERIKNKMDDLWN